LGGGGGGGGGGCFFPPHPTTSASKDDSTTARIHCCLRLFTSYPPKTLSIKADLPVQKPICYSSWAGCSCRRASIAERACHQPACSIPARCRRGWTETPDDGRPATTLENR